jgi:quinoprotein glucose dehydrogenase
MINLQMRLHIASFLILCATLVAHAADQGADDAEYGPRIHSASGEGVDAISHFQVAGGLKVDLFAAEPKVANPVCLRVDNQGRVYVVEGFRRRAGVVDIRAHQDWVEEDLSSQTVADRIALLKRKYGPNIFTFRTESDCVQLLLDNGHVGKADQSTVFADGFNAIEDGIAASVLPTPNGVYVADIPSLYLLRDTTGKGVADVKKVLSTGYGVHISYRGHDMHGLRMGPDGKIYFSIGDRAANAVSAVDGSKAVDTDSGAVYRCNPDGSELELFAYGLRNPQQLVFDEYGNLFTGDNNPDYGDPARWVYVVENGDSGWRIGYQLSHFPALGGQWMWESLWQVAPKLNAAYVVPPVAHLGSGPSGVAYYPGTGLPDHWKNHLFMCDFRGSAGGSGIYAFEAKPKGAGFEVAGQEKFLWGCLVTDMDFSTVGGAYVSDWVNGWVGTGKGRIYRVFDPAVAKSAIVQQTRELLAAGMKGRSSPELGKLLEHPDMRVRQQAQFELADRGAASIELLSHVATTDTNRLARIHAIWGLGQIGRADPKALAAPLSLLSDSDDEVRAQAAKIVGDGKLAAAGDALIKLLGDASPRVRFFAAQALSHLHRHDAVGPLLAMLKANADEDGWLRHAGVMGLVGSDDPATVLASAGDASASVRMSVLLTMRRLHRPEIAKFLTDSNPDLVLEAARAIYDVPIPEAMPALAALATDSHLPEFVFARAVTANFYIGSGESAKALAAVAGDANALSTWRVAALNDLGQWEAPPVLDVFLHAFRPLAARKLADARDAISPILLKLLDDAPDDVRVAAIALIGKLKIDDPGVLEAVVTNSKFPVVVRQQALQVMADRGAAGLGKVVETALADKSEALRCSAIRCLAVLPNTGGRLAEMTKTGSIPERQAAFAAVAGLPGDETDQLLGDWMKKLMASQVPPELRVDIVDAAGKRTAPAIASQVDAYRKSLANGDQLGAYRDLALYRDALVGGDAASGRTIFRERIDVSCIRCHGLGKEGGIVGPKLDGVGDRQTREYLLESIVFPNAKIAKGFETTTLKTRDGKTFTGILKKETAASIELLDAEGKTLTVPTADVTSRERGLSAMPEGFSKILSMRDLRDLVEFLASQHKTPSKKQVN